MDTEFVWSLWKEAQKEAPDMSTIISKVEAKYGMLFRINTL